MEKQVTITLKGHYKFTLTDINTGEKIIKEYDNIVPTVVRALIATHLTNPTPASTLLINYAALGSGTNAPANANTTLQTEVFRNTIASRTSASNIAFATAFFGATEAVGTHKEAGIFASATASANSGILMSRVAIDIVKTNTQTLTLDWTLTIN